MRNKTAVSPERACSVLWMWVYRLFFSSFLDVKTFCIRTMVTACTVLGCSERKGKTSSSNLSFHRFPHKDPERLRKWIQAIGRKDWLPTKHTCICSKHFVESNFVVRPGKSGRRLYDHAVPSQFLSFPERSRNTKRKSLKQQGSMEASHSEQSPVKIGIGVKYSYLYVWGQLLWIVV